MKKLFSLILVLGLFWSGMASANNIIKLVCTPDQEWDSKLKTKKIWIPFNKPKFFIHFDSVDMKIIKIVYSKKNSDVKIVNIPVEKKIENNVMTYQFINGAKLNSVEDVINTYSLIDYGIDSSSFAIYVEQYRPTPEQSSLIIQEMRSRSYSEFQKAKQKFESKNIKYIKLFGGFAGPCERN